MTLVLPRMLMLANWPATPLFSDLKAVYVLMFVMRRSTAKSPDGVLPRSLKRSSCGSSNAGPIPPRLL